MAEDERNQERRRKRDALLSAIGLWGDRADLPEMEEYVRELRAGDRLRRLALLSD